MSTRRFAVLVAVLTTAGIAVLIGWAGFHDALSVRDDLRHVTPRALELAFVLLMAGVAVNLRGIVHSLPSRRGLALLVVAAALIAVKWLPPPTHRIFYDEDIYQNIGQNILWEGRAQMCNEGTIEGGIFDCAAWEYNKEPNGFPFLLSAAYRLRGVDEEVAHGLNHWVFALGALAVYWTAALLFKRTGAAFGAALVYILMPQNLWWAGTVAVEPSASAFAALGIGAWVYFCRAPSAKTALLGASALAFATQFRPESGLVLLVAILATALLSPRLFFRRELYGAGVLLFLLLVPHFAHLWAVRHEKWGSEEQKFSMSYVENNLRTNARYYVEGRDFPPLFALAALLGFTFRRRPRELIVTLAWFLLTFGIFIPFYAGSYRYGADVRFSVVSAAPLAMLAGAGLASVARWIRRRFGRHRALAAAPYVLAVYAFTSYLPLVRAVGMEGWQARADHEVARKIADELPGQSIVLTHNPGMLHVMGRSAAQASLVSYQQARVDHFFDRYPGGVYFHYNFWCNVDNETQNQFCNDVLSAYATQVIFEESAGFYRFVLYRLLPN